MMTPADAESSAPVTAAKAAAPVGGAVGVAVAATFTAEGLEPPLASC